jgi:hypothetical protein
MGDWALSFFYPKIGEIRCYQQKRKVEPEQEHTEVIMR